MEKIDELSVFLPAYNEEANIQKSVTQMVAILGKVAQKWELIVVNDGSIDKTPEIVKELINRDKRVRMITHTFNRGYGVALQSGFYSVKYEWIAYTDADLQFDFSEIKKFIKKQRETNADLVVGCYKDRKVPLFRTLGSEIYQWLVFLLFGIRLKDADCAFKLIRKKVIEKIPRLEAEKGPFLCSELLIKANKKGFKIVQIPVHHFPRLKGESKGIKPRVILNGFIDLLKFRRKLRGL